VARTGSPRALREVVEPYARLLGQPIDICWGGRPYRDSEVMQPCDAAMGGGFPAGLSPARRAAKTVSRAIAAQRQSVHSG